MSEEMINLINQAREQARIDGFKRFLGKNAKIFFGIILVLLLVGAGYIGFRYYQKASQEKFSTILHQALVYQQAGDLLKAKENLKKIIEAKSAPNGVQSIAALRYGALLLDEGKKSQAAKVYESLAECNSCDEYLQNLGALFTVKTWLADEEEIQKEDLAARIEKLESNASLLKFQIAESRAFLEMKKGNLEKSYAIFEMIIEASDSSQSVKEKAEEGKQILAGKGFTPKQSEEDAKEKAEADKEKLQEKK